MLKIFFILFIAKNLILIGSTQMVTFPITGAQIPVNPQDADIHRIAAFATTKYCEKNSLNYKLQTVKSGYAQITVGITYVLNVKLVPKGCFGNHCPTKNCRLLTQKMANKLNFLRGGCTSIIGRK